jgi:hypothetical protein
MHVEWPTLGPSTPAAIQRLLAVSLGVASDDVVLGRVTPLKNEVVKLEPGTDANPGAVLRDSLIRQFGATLNSGSGRFVVVARRGDYELAPLKSIARILILDACEASLRQLSSSFDFGGFDDSVAPTTAAASGSIISLPTLQSRLLVEVGRHSVGLRDQLEETAEVARQLRETIFNLRRRTDEAAATRTKVTEEQRRRHGLDELTRSVSVSAEQLDKLCSSAALEPNPSRVHCALDEARGQRILLSKECGRLAKSRLTLDQEETDRGVALRARLDSVRASIVAEQRRYTNVHGGLDFASIDELVAFCDECDRDER